MYDSESDFDELLYERMNLLVCEIIAFQIESKLVYSKPFYGTRKGHCSESSPGMSVVCIGSQAIATLMHQDLTNCMYPLPTSC